MCNYFSGTVQLALVSSNMRNSKQPKSRPQGTSVFRENTLWQKSMWDNVPLWKEMELIWCCCHRSVMPHPALYPSLPLSASLLGVTQWLFNELHVYTVARCQRRSISSYHWEGPPPTHTHLHITLPHYPVPPSHCLLQCVGPMDGFANQALASVKFDFLMMI